MMTETVATRLQALERQLRELGQVAIAISGGVDSTTLAVVAGRTLGNPRCEMFHSVSSAGGSSRFSGDSARRGSLPPPSYRSNDRTGSGQSGDPFRRSSEPACRNDRTLV